MTGGGGCFCVDVITRILDKENEEDLEQHGQYSTHIIYIQQDYLSSLVSHWACPMPPSASSLLLSLLPLAANVCK